MEDPEGGDKPKQSKRKRNPSEWKREKRKRSIIAGESHISVKGELIEPKKIGSDCHCKLKCYEKVDANLRQRLFNGYYSLKTYDEQNAYLFGLIKKQDVKRKKNMNSDRRTCTYKYHVRDQGKEIQVCKLAFAHIHAVSFRKIRTLSEKLDQNILFPRDGRGRHGNRPTKVSPETVELIKNHIFQILKSNDLKNFMKEDKNKQMMPELNVAKLHINFLQLYEPEAINPATGQPIPGYTPKKVKSWLYRKVFHDEVKSKDFQTLKKRLDVFSDVPTPTKNLLHNNDMGMLSKDRCDKDVKKSRRKGTAKKLSLVDPMGGYGDGSLGVSKQSPDTMMFQQKAPQSCSNLVHFPIVPNYNTQATQNIQLQVQRGAQPMQPQLAQNMHHQPHTDAGLHQHPMQEFNSHHNFLATRAVKDPSAGRMTLLQHSINPQAIGISHHHSMATFGGGMNEHLQGLQRRNLQGQHYGGGLMHAGESNQQLDLSVNDMTNAFYS